MLEVREDLERPGAEAKAEAQPDHDGDGLHRRDTQSWKRFWKGQSMNRQIEAKEEDADEDRAFEHFDEAIIEVRFCVSSPAAEDQAQTCIGQPGQERAAHHEEYGLEYRLRHRSVQEGLQVVG